MNAHRHSFTGGHTPAWVEQPGRGCRCSWCGSVSPGDAANMLAQGATMELADMKYGWPHKFYVHGPGESWAKFYTEHLQDADAEQRAAIEKGMGLSFVFESGGRVSWRQAT